MAAPGASHMLIRDDSLKIPPHDSPSGSISGTAPARTHWRSGSLPRSSSGYSLATLPAPNTPPPPSRPSAGPRHGTIIKRRQPSFDPALKRAPSYKLKGRDAGPVGKWVFIVNGTKLKEWAELSPRLLGQIKGAEYKVCITKRRGHGIKLAEMAARAGANLIAAVGGDGTLNEVVDGVMRAGIMGDDGLPLATLTVLPLGTASDFHRSMAWDPADFERAMWRIGHEGSVAVLDVARMECDGPSGPVTRHFINMASCGASAKAAQRVAGWRWLGASLSYRAASLAALFRYRRRPLGVRIDGGEWQRLPASTMVAVGNGAYFGHGLKIAPDASPYSGQLQVVTANGLGAWDFLLRSWRLRMGTHLKIKGFSSTEGRRVDVVEWKNKKRQPVEPAFAGAGGAGWAPSAYTSAEDSVSLSWPSQASGEGDTSSGASTALETPRGSDGSSRTGGATRAGAPDGGMRRGASVSPLDERSTPGSSSRAPSDGASSVTSWGRRTPPPQQQRSKPKPKSKGKGKGSKGSGKEEPVDYGPVPVEVDGEVIGHAPFTVTVLPGAIKFKI